MRYEETNPAQVIASENKDKRSNTTRAGSFASTKYNHSEYEFQVFSQQVHDAIQSGLHMISSVFEKKQDDAIDGIRNSDNSA